MANHGLDGILMKARKLYSVSVLAKAAQLKGVGVPVRRIRRDLSITISVPTFNALIEHYSEMITYQTRTPAIAKTIQNSLFPPWVTPDIPAAQDQPTDWKYIGRFPVGAWIQQT